MPLTLLRLPQSRVGPFAAGRSGTVPTFTEAAPIDGVVAQSTASVGQRLGSSAGGALLFVITAPYSQLDLRAPVDPAAVKRLPVGVSARVTVADLPRKIFQGRLLDDVTSRGGGRLVLRVVSSGAFLRPGMTAAARLGIGIHKDVLVVPDEALRFARASDARHGTAGGSAVYVLDSDRPPRRVPVTTMASDGWRTEIAPGALTPGTRVILGLR